MTTKRDNYLASHTVWNATTCTFGLQRNSPNFDNPRLVILQWPSLPVKILSSEVPGNQRNIQYVCYKSSSEYCTAVDIIR